MYKKLATIIESSAIVFGCLLIVFIIIRPCITHRQPIHAIESLEVNTEDINTNEPNEEAPTSNNQINILDVSLHVPSMDSSISSSLSSSLTHHSVDTILLLGDSILDNSYYVSPGKSVYDYIKRNVPKSTVIKNLARDGAIISEVETSQLYGIPITYNKPTTALVLSVGGNDFLSGNAIDLVKPQYKELLQHVRSQFNKAKIYLVNLYRPLDPSLQLYGTIISMWNSFLEQLVKENLADAIVPISNVILEPTDLVHKIEPSNTGGEKIAKTILHTIQTV